MVSVVLAHAVSIRGWALHRHVRAQTAPLDKAAHKALEEHWQKYFAECPEARARFAKVLADYTGMLRARGF